MNKFEQRGLSLSSLMVWGVILALVAITGMRVVPSAIEYYKIKKAIHSTVGQTNANSTVADVRKTFSKFMDVEMVEFSPEELEITKENSQIVISFDYEKRIHLFANVSLLINYSASTGGKTKD